MSYFDAAPPNTHAGGDDDALRPHGTLPMNPPVEGDEQVDMDAYRASVPKWKRVYQNSLTQMLLMSVQAFCGPAMDDAIAGECRSACPREWPRAVGDITGSWKLTDPFPSGLGGGGLATPQTYNIAYVNRS